MNQCGNHLIKHKEYDLFIMEYNMYLEILDLLNLKLSANYCENQLKTIYMSF